MNSTKTFRNGVQSEIEAWRLANFPQYQAFYENTPDGDQDTISDIWIDVQIRWYGSKLVSMGLRPMGRHSGVVVVNVYYRSGTGTAAPDDVADSAIELLRTRRLAGGMLYMPQRLQPTDFEGWQKAGLMVPFSLDDV